MATRWDEVRAWRDRLRAANVDGIETALSPAGLAEARDAALDGIDDDALTRVASYPARPWRRAALVTTGTVHTAALEWLALLLGRGSQVVWKHPAESPGLAPLAAELAGELPLAVTSDREAIQAAEVVIVMGSDETVAAVRREARDHTVVYGHGHAWSCAWITGNALPVDHRVPEGFQDPWGRVAADAALHDGRGCLSPALIFTPLPIDEALDALADAMERAAARWPTGTLSSAEAALIRSRRALARVVGERRRGEGWSLHGLTVDHVAPISLPRSLAVAHAPHANAAARCAAQWGAQLSTVGTDDPMSVAAWVGAGATRVCATGRMQRPPLDRVHDGVRWVHQTYRAVGIEQLGTAEA